MTAADRLIVALDFTSLEPALAMARRLRGLIRTVKVGSALFTACGPEAIRRLRALGFEVMLDLKWFDIPSTVELSCRAAVRHRVSMLTVHARGERAMLDAAVQGIRDEARRRRLTRPRVLGVTVLTSEGSARPRQGVATGQASVRREVVRLAHQVLQARCDGIVASAQEAAVLRRRFGTRLRIVCPGIRPAPPVTPSADPATGGEAGPASAADGPARRVRDDQRRVCTPREALARGADLLIVGRPITGARDPRAATQAILNDMECC